MEEAIDNEIPAKPKRKKRRRVRSLAALPSLLTLGNAISGFAAIVLLLKAYAQIQEGLMTEASLSMYYATGFLALGMFCDMLDGRVARMTGTDSQFGAQLDSLCDAITFCLAPAVFLRVFGEAIIGPGMGEGASIGIRAVWAVSALYLACGLLRLARFNVETSEDDDHSEFSGLPTPAACGAIVSLFFVSRFLGTPEQGIFAGADFLAFALPVFGAGIALLMISRVRYDHAINRLVHGAKTIPQMVLVLGIIGGSFVIFPRLELVFALLLLLYVLWGVVLWGAGWLRARGANSMILRALPVHHDDNDDDDDEKAEVEA